MSSIAVLNAQRKAAGLPIIRFNIRKFQDQDVVDLRDAYAALYEISLAAAGDSRGYWGVARGHGYDLDLCHNDDRIFLTWHRAYIYHFEKTLTAALQWKRKDPNLLLTLPYWDWTLTDPATDAPNGIPKVLNDPTYVSSGHTVANPLHSAPSWYRINNQNLTGAQRFTQRYPNRLLGVIPELKSDVADYLRESNFDTFSINLDSGAHGAVHVVVGGTNAASPLPGRIGDMGTIISAAYDPIFWLHHAMVDKVWADWQAKHGDSTVPQHVRDTIVYGNLKGSGVLDAERSLRYIYSDQSPASMKLVAATAAAPAKVEVAKSSFFAAAAAAPAAPTPASAPATQQLAIGKIGPNFNHARVQFHSLRPPTESYEIRAFFNHPAANAQTPKTDPAYAGRLVLFGHGMCHGAPGHCDPSLAVRDDYDLRPKHPLRFEKTNYFIDVTKPLRRVLDSQPGQDINLTLVTVAVDESLCAPDEVEHDGVSVVTSV